MATTYTMKINQMQVVPQEDGKTDVVVKVTWVYVGTNGMQSFGVSNVSTITYDPNGSFTPYADLTEEQVSGWVTGSWTPEEKAGYEATINAQLALQIPPLPWSAS